MFPLSCVFVMAEELAVLRGSGKVFELRITNLQGKTLDLLRHEINEQNKRVKNTPMKC